MSGLARRLSTAAIALPAALGIVFFAPGDLAFVAFLAIVLVIVVEFLALARHVAPSAPLGSLLIWMPAASLAAFWLLRDGPREIPAWWLPAALFAVCAAAACTVLFGRTEVRDGLAAIGILAFAIPYFGLPPAALYWLQALDPWLLLALLAVVWLSDTGAWVVGKAIGRHKLAPAVSPGKTWEGTAAGFAAGVLAMVVWSQLRLGEVRPELVAVAAATAIAAQLGDLIESVIKRGAGMKDSSNLLPGHGGFFDRLDALLLATPVYVVGLHAVGVDSLLIP